MSAAPTAYELRVAGHLDDHWATWLGSLTMSHNQDGTTTLLVHVTDQAQLHGVLANLRDLGATLLWLRPNPHGERGTRGESAAVP